MDKPKQPNGTLSETPDADDRTTTPVEDELEPIAPPVPTTAIARINQAIKPQDTTKKKRSGHGIDHRRKLPLGQLLIEAGHIKDDQLEMALAEQKRTHALLGEVMVSLGFVTEVQVAEALALQTGVPFQENTFENVPADVLKMIPEDVCRKNRLIPLGLEGSILRLAMANPFDVVALDFVRTQTGLIPFPSIGTWSEISKTIDKHFAKIESYAGGFDELVMAAEKQALNAGSLQEISEGGPLMELVDELIIHGVDERATDIHIEPEGEIIRTRYRIDSMLHPGPTLPKKLQAPIAARCKVMAGLNVAENRVPQDGRIRFNYKGRRVDLRIATFLCNHGENINMRVLDKSSVILSIEKLGFFDDHLAKLIHFLDKPHGIILVTGPTGCGKTTTLYAAIARLNTVDVNIMTIEDPIEYDLNMVRQSQVNYKAGVTFATGLRALLRQDPDIVFIGEMRDEETATLAIRAAMTGHLVFSTLHTNTAVGSINRMADMGVDSLLLSDALIACIGQRLARNVCPTCRELVPCPPHRYSEMEEVAIREKVEWDGMVAEARGCPECKGRGYKGRSAIYEMFEMTHTAQKYVIEKRFGQDLTNLARNEGMRTMYEDAVRRVLVKSLTIDEMDRVVEREGREMLEG